MNTKNQVSGSAFFDANDFIFSEIFMTPKEIEKVTKEVLFNPQSNEHVQAKKSNDFKKIKRLWNADEDKILIEVVNSIATKKIKWREVEKIYNENAVKKTLSTRTNKQCRDRYLDHLKPGLNKKKWTDNEKDKLFDAYKKYDKQWTKIKNEFFPSRTAMNIRNHYYQFLRDSEKEKSKKIHEIENFSITKIMPGPLFNFEECFNDKFYEI